MMIYDLTIFLLPMVIVYAQLVKIPKNTSLILSGLAGTGLFLEFLISPLKTGNLMIQVSTIFLFLWVLAAMMIIKGQAIDNFRAA